MLKRLSHIFIVFLLLGMATGCGATFDDTPVSGVGGSLGPESAVKSFFEDLNAALHDHDLAAPERHVLWRDRLSSYFAPDERTEIALEISEALSQIAYDRASLGTDQAMTIDLEVQIVSSRQSEDRAIVFVNDTGSSLVIGEWRQPFKIPDIIGTDGAIPVIRVQNSWFLSEGWVGWDQF